MGRKLSKNVKNRERWYASVMFIVTFVSETRVCGSDEGYFTIFSDELNRVV